MRFFEWVVFFHQYLVFRKQAGKSAGPFRFGKLHPCVEDKDTPIETRGHYFHQDLLVANKIFLRNPKIHVDVGSRMDGFIAHVASFRQIEAIDIRPPGSAVKNVKFRQADVMDPQFELGNYCDSLSSLHAVEHFGLGRYGDRLDFFGHLHGLDGLDRILLLGGTFYLSVPIGEPRIEFNAHRVFSLRYLLDLFEGKYKIRSFSLVTDQGHLEKEISLDNHQVDKNFYCHYGCAIFELVKINDANAFFAGKRLEANLNWNTKPLDMVQREERPLMELRKNFRELRGQVLSAGQDASKEWLNDLAELEKLVLNDDPRRFLRWDIIQKTMFVGNEAYITEELDFLQNQADWTNRWQGAIGEVDTGCPVLYNNYPGSSGNMIHQAYHVCSFEKEASISIDSFDLIVEFGGGYGCMCRLIHNLGFRGSYLIYDLPHFSALQRYYIESSRLEKATSDKLETQSVAFLSDLNKLETVLDTSLKEDMRTLFIATWSLSETPLRLRNTVFPLVSNFSGYLIAYQSLYHGINNEAYFLGTMNDHPTIQWKIVDIQHLPGNFYLFGTRFR